MKSTSEASNAPLRPPRVPDMVAGALRRRILSGQLSDGALLPKQSELLKEFRVSKQSLREALRILELEGLLSVRRGNVGGSVVRIPPTQSASYALGLVLKSRNVGLRDVGLALQQLEPVCAALCAARPDRNTTVVPALRNVFKQSQLVEGDGVEHARLARQFHTILVEECGNDTIIVTVGAIESLWSGHLQAWAEEASRGEGLPGEFAASSLVTHEKLITLIENGDADEAARVAREHLSSTYFFSQADSSKQITIRDYASAPEYM